MKETDENQEKNVRITIQVKESERKAWKRFALDNDITVTEAIRRGMREITKKLDDN